jgi:copper chaperone CopZ
MEFKALRVAGLTEEVAGNLETTLDNLTGVESFAITLETQELNVIFDEHRLSFRTLIQEMAKAGCPLQRIDAALLL